MANTNSGQAFPNAVAADSGGCLNHGKPGMTLRQWYAGQALSAIVGNCSAKDNRDIDGACERIAALAFKIADAMLAEGERPPA